MKTIKKLASFISIMTLGFSTALASGIPDEPMVIYGNISGSTSGTLKIYDSENNLLKSVSFSNKTYGTNKTFELNKKISLDSFNGELIFKLDGYNFSSKSTSNCNSTAIFQSSKVCNYDLVFNSLSTSGGSSSPSYDLKTCTSSDLECKLNQVSYTYKYAEKNGISCKGGDLGKACEIKTTTIETQTQNDVNNTENSSQEVKKENNENTTPKIIETIKTNSKTTKNIKVTNKSVSGLNLVILEGEDSYNSVMENITKNIAKKFYIENSKTELVEQLNKLAYTYKGIKEGNSTVDELKNQANKYAKMFKARITKDLILKKAEAKKALEKAKEEQNKKVEAKKIIAKDNIDNNNYTVAVYSVKMAADKNFSSTKAWLYNGDKLKILEEVSPYVFKAQIVSSRDGYEGEIGYIGKNFLRKN